MDKKTITIVAVLLIVAIVAIVAGYWYGSGKGVPNNGVTTDQVRNGFNRIEKRISDTEARFKSLSDTIDRGREENATLRGIVGEIKDRNRRDQEAIQRVENGVCELENIFREVRESGRNQNQPP